MFELKNPLKSHIIQVFEAYRDNSMPDKIKRGILLLEPLIERKQPTQPIEPLLEKMVVRSEAEKHRSTLSYSFLTREAGLDSKLFKGFPANFDYTSFLFGYIHYHVPSFLMAYKREKGEAATFSSLKLFAYRVETASQEKSVHLSFCDKSLTHDELVRFSNVSEGSVGVVTLYPEDMLLPVLQPQLKAFGKAEDRSVNLPGLVQPITLTLSPGSTPSDEVQLLHDLLMLGVTVDKSIMDSDRRDQLIDRFTKTIKGKIDRKEQLSHCLDLLQTNYLPLIQDMPVKQKAQTSELRASLIEDIFHQALGLNDLNMAEQAYADLPVKTKKEYALGMAEYFITTKKYKKADACYLEAGEKLPYAHAKAFHERMLLAPLFFKRGFSQDNEFNKYSGTVSVDLNGVKDDMFLCDKRSLTDEEHDEMFGKPGI